MLEFRLNELNDVVDYFVLVECIKTHTIDRVRFLKVTWVPYRGLGAKLL